MPQFAAATPGIPHKRSRALQFRNSMVIAKCLSLSVSYSFVAGGSARWHANCSTNIGRRSNHRAPMQPAGHPRGMSEPSRSDLMNSKSNFPLSFDPDAWELSVVAHRPAIRITLSTPVKAALCSTAGSRAV
jgi:hypothetical protein